MAHLGPFFMKGHKVDAIPSADKWVIGTIAVLGFGASIIQFVWNGSRTDIAALEGRLDRAVAQVERQLNELKASDEKRVTIISHNDLKEQITTRANLIDKIIDRNSNSIAELLVKKDVFDRYLADQAERDRTSRESLEREIMMLRNAIQSVRGELNDFRNKSIMPARQ